MCECDSHVRKCCVRVCALCPDTHTTQTHVCAQKLAGNINTGEGGSMGVLDLSETSQAEQDRHATLLRRVEAERRARSIIVPTKPSEVAERLRALGQPVRLFGEHIADVRER